MAYTVTTRKQTVHGNQRVMELKVSADAATAIIPTGLQFIDALAFAPISMASAGIKLKANEGTASTAIAGSIGVTGAASGDDFFLVVYGR